MTMDPVGATACIREARLVVCPMGVYSVCPAPVLIERTTTSPVFTPTRPSIGIPPSAINLRRVTAQLLLQPERRIQRALRMILMRDRRPEQRENAVAGGLHDVTVVAMRGVDHQLQGGIDDGARFFGVEVLLQLGRALDVSKQCGDRLALALQSF